MRITTLLALVPVLALSACGRDEPASGAPAAAYRAAADAVCVEHARAVAVIPIAPPQDFADQAPYDGERARLLAEQTRGVRALDVPRPLQGRHGAFLAAADAYATAYADTARLARAGDRQRWSRAVAVHQQRGGELLAAASALGLAACARRPSAASAADVRTVVERVLLGKDPEGSCERDVSERFLESNLSGSVGSCREILTGLARDGATVTFLESVGVDGITGVDDVIASANVTFPTARGAAGKRLVYDLVRRDGRWVLDSAFEQDAVSGEEEDAAA